MLLILLTSSVLGTLGFPGMLMAPVTVFRQGRVGASEGIISWGALLFFVLLSLVPLGFLVTLIVLAILQDS
jgi:hypothetical protein